MEELDLPLPLAETSPEVREKAGPNGPFDKTGGVKQGYLFSLEDGAGRILEGTLDRLPRHPIEHILPPALGGPVSRELTEQAGPTGATIYEQIASQGFSFPDWLVTDYVLALATKPLVILSGISGTGKTKLAQIIARLVAPDETAQTIVAGPPVPDAGSFVHTIGLSTIKYRGLTLPIASLILFEDLPQKGERVDLTIRLASDKEYVGWIGNVDFTEPSGRTVLRLFWEKSLGTWLSDSAGEGDYLLLTPHVEKNALTILMELHKATRVSRQMPSPRIAFLSVRPDWTDNRSLLGYYNPLTAQYQSTELLALLLRAKPDPDRPHFVILDEMNLAKVEYYFSDFLSAMEAGTEMILHDSQAELFLDEGELTGIPPRLSVPKTCSSVGP
jgi:energy-coupling factor transporter ATP-binding protein EcfA2